MVTIVAFYRAFAEQIVAIGAVLVRPLLAETHDLARFGSGDGFPVRGNRYIGMADVAFADFFGLMQLVIESHAVIELDDV